MRYFTGSFSIGRDGFVVRPTGYGPVARYGIFRRHDWKLRLFDIYKTREEAERDLAAPDFPERYGRAIGSSAENEAYLLLGRTSRMRLSVTEIDPDYEYRWVHPETVNEFRKYGYEVVSDRKS